MRTSLLSGAASATIAGKVRPGDQPLSVIMNSFGQPNYVGAAGGLMEENAFFGSFKDYFGTAYSGECWPYYQTGTALTAMTAYLSQNPNYAAVMAFGTTNSIFANGLTAAQTLASLASWAGIIRSICPSAVILVMGCPPRSQQPNANYGTGDAAITAANQAMFNVDSALLANPKLYGIDKCLNIRAASINGVAMPFGFMDNNGTGTVISVPSGGWAAYFQSAANNVYDSNAANSQVHPSTASSALLVNALAYTFMGMM